MLRDRRRRGDPDARARFKVALSGGSTPRGLYALLASDRHAARVEWSRVHVFWGDERCVAPQDPASNQRMAREALLDHVPLPNSHVHAIRGEDEPAAAASRYEQALREAFATPVGPPRSAPGARFDLVLLGLGEDGHTASLFPGFAPPCGKPGAGWWRSGREALGLARHADPARDQRGIRGDLPGVGAREGGDPDARPLRASGARSPAGAGDPAARGRAALARRRRCRVGSGFAARAPELDGEADDHGHPPRCASAARGRRCKRTTRSFATSTCARSSPRIPGAASASRWKPPGSTSITRSTGSPTRRCGSGCWPRSGLRASESACAPHRRDVPRREDQRHGGARRAARGAARAAGPLASCWTASTSSPEVHAVLDRMDRLRGARAQRRWLGHTGQRIRSIVNLGIGGSDLGPGWPMKRCGTTAIAPSTCASSRTSIPRISPRPPATSTPPPRSSSSPRRPSRRSRR